MNPADQSEQSAAVMAVLDLPLKNAERALSLQSSLADIQYYLESLRKQRAELQVQVEQDEKQKLRLQGHIRTAGERLAYVTDHLAKNVILRNRYDQKLAELETTYHKALEMSSTLRHLKDST